MSVGELAKLVPIVKSLRELGASVIKIDGGALTLAFDGALVEPHVAQETNGSARRQTPAEEEKELLFASADDA